MRIHSIPRAVRRCLGLLSAVLLLCGLLAGTARAEDGGLLQRGDRVYLGWFTDSSRFGDPLSFPVSWLVLDPDATNSGEPGVFLLSQYVVQQTGVRYNREVAVWPGSLAQQWCTDFALSAFSDAERAMIPAVSKSEEPLPNYALNWAANELSSEQVFFLSAWEAKDYIGPEGTPGLSAETPDGIVTYWWFRSPHFWHPDWSGLVLQGDDIHDSQVENVWGARPAMNLDPRRAVLLLPAQGQREVGVLAAPERPEDGAWKLTVPDEARSLTVSRARIRDGVLQFDYENAPVGEDEYLSLLACSPQGETLLWGRLCRTEQAAGTAELPLGALSLPQDAQLYVFAEREGGDFRTNYASPLCALTPLLLADEAEQAARAQAEAEAEAEAAAAQAGAERVQRSPLPWLIPAALVLLLTLVFLLRRR